MKRPSWKSAIEWIVSEDDTEWVDGEGALGTASVTACLVADLFGKTTEDVRRAIQREFHKRGG